MAEYLAQNPRTAVALTNPSKSDLTPKSTLPPASQFFDIDLDNPTEFLPENSEKLAHRMTQIAAERPTELATEFIKTFSVLAWNHAEKRERLLQLARYVGDTPAGDPVKDIVLQQASLFFAFAKYE